MRIAIVSDVHGNVVSLDAVLSDLDTVRPDVVVLGGDLALGGPRPVEVVDRLRELGWPSVLGNTDDVLAPERMRRELEGTFVAQAAARTREMLGPDRVAWLTSRPLQWRGDGIAVMHAVPGDCWSIVPHDADDEVLRGTYGPLAVPVAVYGHIHHPYVRNMGDLTVVNSGALSLSLNGDLRACYVVVEDGAIAHRQVAYDVERVADDLFSVGYPNAATYASWLRTGIWTSPPRTKEVSPPPSN